MANLYKTRGNWPGIFRRVVRKPDGQPTDKVFTFSPGVPLEVPARYMTAIQQDIDKGVLVPVTLNAKGRLKSGHEPEPEKQPAAKPKPNEVTDGQPDATAGHGE